MQDIGLYFTAVGRRMAHRVCGCQRHYSGSGQLHVADRDFRHRHLQKMQGLSGHFLVFLQFDGFMFVLAAFFRASLAQVCFAMTAFFIVPMPQRYFYQLAHAVVHVERGARGGANVQQ